MKKKKGFTLVELLATIVVLAIVVSISVYVGIQIVKKSKEKTYEVTINEVESHAKEYVLENSNKLIYINDGEIEYQCVTIQNLIDFGYLDNDIENSKINENETIKKDKYIYIERDANSKTVTKSIYLNGKETDSNYDAYYKKCGIANSGNEEIYGDIWFSSNPDVNTWSKSKIVTIYYSLKNIGDYSNLKDYSYGYTYYDNTPNKTVLGSNTFPSEDMKFQTEVTVTKNGTIDGKIIHNNNSQIKTYIVKGIDNEGPVVVLGNYNKGNVSKSITIPFTLTDAGIGVDYNSFTKDDIVVKIGDYNVPDFVLEDKKNGNYNLIINDSTHNGEVTIVIENNKIIDKLENGNDRIELKTGIIFRNAYKITYDANGGSACNPGTKDVMYGEKYGDLCNTSRLGYTFLGWFTAVSGGNLITKDSVVEINSNQTLYAQWVVNSFYLDVNGLLDNVERGNISGYGTVDVYINGNLVSNDVTDYYTLLPYGTTYEIRDIKSTTGHSYKGVQTGSLKGTVTGLTDVRLKYNTNVYNVYTVTYNSNGGNTCNPSYKKVEQNKQYGTLCVPTRNTERINNSILQWTENTYSFIGWYTEPIGGSLVTNSTIVSATSNHTLYAHWRVYSEQKMVEISCEGGGGGGGGGGCQCSGNSGCGNCGDPGSYVSRSDGW